MGGNPPSGGAAPPAPVRELGPNTMALHAQNEGKESEQRDKLIAAANAVLKESQQTTKLTAQALLVNRILGFLTAVLIVVAAFTLYFTIHP